LPRRRSSGIKSPTATTLVARNCAHISRRLNSYQRGDNTRGRLHSARSGNWFLGPPDSIGVRGVLLTDARKLKITRTYLLSVSDKAAILLRQPFCSKAFDGRRKWQGQYGEKVIQLQGNGNRPDRVLPSRANLN
jgi:hypothetical protein